ncbi:MAG: hypothetical protein KC593_24620 [Myxococcales bacterium]|nr:hypothetical protein [Myxococcales bacterium]MCB9625771.1 hypothetical protein [Sandaracinaceae bacterium]
MNAKRAPRVLSVLPLAVTAVLGLSGCFRHAEVITTIGNPFVVGGVMPNTVQQLHASTENQRQIPPGSLTDEAILTRMDESAACFSVSLRAIDEGSGQTWTDLRNWNVSLLVDNVEMVDPAIELHPPEHNQYQGVSWQQVQVGQRTVCVDRNGVERAPNTITQANPCGRWETRPIMEGRWLPALVTVTTATGEVCFQNQGYLTASSAQVTLKMERARRRLDFTWEFR